MGTDIHYVVEYESEKYGWIGVFCTKSSFGPYQNGLSRFENRNYDFFARLAGVRGVGPDPAGVPDNASPLTKIYCDYWGDDGHSHTWSTLRNFVVAHAEANNTASTIAIEALSGNEWALHDYVGMDRKEKFSDYRVVFWFDS